MSNKFTYQTLLDTTTHTVVKLTGTFDGASGEEANNNRIVANTLYGALDANGGLMWSGTSANNALPFYDLSILRIWYDTNIDFRNGTIAVNWSANNSSNTANAFFITGTGNFSIETNWPPITNNGAVDKNGNIGIATTGTGANTTYTIIMELRKDNAMYQRGQYNDPAAFSFGPYALKP